MTMSQIQAIRERVRRLGARPAHELRILRLWAQAKPQNSGRRPLESFMPTALREDLAQLTDDLNGLLRLQSAHPAEDGSVRWLLALQDGQTLETVGLPRDGLCVSSQVGCAVGCVFCMTGRDGLIRQVGSAEIVAQVAFARLHRPVKKVVFMGMGEPAHNLDNVMEAIEVLGTVGNIAHKSLVFSTVGDPRVFERLPMGLVKPALAVSLHTTRADLRAQLLPRAPKMSPEELVEAAEVYAHQTGYPIIDNVDGNGNQHINWVAELQNPIAVMNDSEEELEGIVRLLKGKYALMNMIPYNAIDDLPFKRPSWERAAEMARTLHRRGILTKLRNSAGQDVEGGCGQLRARELQSALNESPVMNGTSPIHFVKAKPATVL
jgi:23S rRNA (adenine2503-C2)-methyltransferase